MRVQISKATDLNLCAQIAVSEQFENWRANKKASTKCRKPKNLNLNLGFGFGFGFDFRFGFGFELLEKEKK